MTHPLAKNFLGWLISTAARLPEIIQPAAEINEALGRPPSWLESHAGIRQRRIWGDQDPLSAACESARECLSRAGVTQGEVGALLVTSEAPPMPVGLAAALHHRLGLAPETAGLEIGGACTGFLAAWWTATKMLPSIGTILIISLECHSQYLAITNPREPTEAGPTGSIARSRPARLPGSTAEAAALFGDGAAACLLCDRPIGDSAVPIRAILHRTDGSGAGLLQVERSSTGNFELHMQGVSLAGRAVRAMAQSVRDLVQQEGLELTDLAAVVSHGGNGRMPAFLALQLGLPPEKVWSQTPNTGNLGSASLPVAWAMAPELPRGPVAWTAVGAGLTWAAALTGELPKSSS
jgi:3-oxoacyl-[acyl-carrier-protein] synthase III